MIIKNLFKWCDVLYCLIKKNQMIWDTAPKSRSEANDFVIRAPKSWFKMFRKPAPNDLWNVVSRTRSEDPI